MKKIVLICNDSNTIISFRKELILFLQKNDYEVYVIASDDVRKEEVKQLNVKFVLVPFDNRSTNIIDNLLLKNKFYKEIKCINPDIVFTFQAKANVYGVPAAKKAGVKKIFAMVEGLGDPLQKDSTVFSKFVKNVLVSLYKRAFKDVSKVFFLNSDDKDFFIENKMVSENKVVVINGIGIDTDRFVPDYKIKHENNVVLLSRLLKTKGIIDYCEVAKSIREIRKDINFYLYGNEVDITLNDIKKYLDNGDIIYGGYSSDIENIYKSASIVVSFSIGREGFPRIILEAMSYAKPVIATSVIGNKYAVVDSQTGYLIKPGDFETFKEKIIELIDNKKLNTLMGKNAREYCIKNYSSEIINSYIFSIIDK